MDRAASGRSSTSLSPWVLVLVLISLPGAAHEADVIRVWVDSEPGETVKVTQRLRLPEQALLALAPLDSDHDARISPAELSAAGPMLDTALWSQVPMFAAKLPCLRRWQRAELKAPFVELRAEYACPPGDLRQQFRILSVLPSNFRVILSGLDGELFASRTQQTLALPVQARAPSDPSRSFLQWVWLGVEHILTGWDHLLFVMALVLVSEGLRRTALLLTSFTVAHSLTLGLTALGVFALSPEQARWVEVVIAASIIWVAAENLFLGTHRHRPIVTFGFGLVHGMGFAAALSGYELGDRFLTALAGFNLGVEAGQLAVVLVAVPVLRFFRARWVYGAQVVRSGSLLIAGAGVVFCVQRVIG